MEIAVTFELRRDSLEDDFKVCKQKILCQIPITSQMIAFIEKVVNINVKERECFIIKAPCSIEAYTLLLPSPQYKKELKLHFLQTYEGDIISIPSKIQIF